MRRRLVECVCGGGARSGTRRLVECVCGGGVAPGVPSASEETTAEFTAATKSACRRAGGGARFVAVPGAADAESCTGAPGPGQRYSAVLSSWRRAEQAEYPSAVLGACRGTHQASGIDRRADVLAEIREQQREDESGN